VKLAPATCPSCNAKIALWRLPENFRYIRCQSCDEQLVLSKDFLNGSTKLLRYSVIPWFLIMFGGKFVMTPVTYKYTGIGISLIIIMLSMGVLWSLCTKATYEKYNEE
jgi:hypothetical protein